MLHITPEMARAAYEYLRTTLPFRRWKLPPGDRVEWTITGTDKFLGRLNWYVRSTEEFELELSQVRITSTQTLIETLAHEMCHMRQRQLRSPNLKSMEYGHGKDFDKLKEQVCKHHGFNKDYF